MKHIPALDGIRGIAIISVILFHFNLPQNLEAGVLKGGFLGVDIFFVLSGFLITKILLEEYHSSKTINLLNFYYRRALRLFPALFLVLSIAFIYVLIADNSAERDKVIRGIFSTIFYYSNWVNAYEAAPLGFLTHTWSLALEEQFYIFWPILLLLILSFDYLKANFSKIVLLLIFLSWSAKSYFAYNSQFLRAFAGTDARSDALLIGCLLAYWQKERSLLITYLSKSVFVYLAAIIIVTMLVFAPHDSLYMYFGGYTFFAFLTAILLNGLSLNYIPLLSHVSNHSVLRYLGKISYGLYLWHLPMHSFCAYLLDHRFLLARNFMAIGLSLFIAHLSFKFVELPITVLRKKLNKY